MERRWQCAAVVLKGGSQATIKASVKPKLALGQNTSTPVDAFIAFCGEWQLKPEDVVQFSCRAA